MKILNSHFKVYLAVAREGQAKCPYCGKMDAQKVGEHFTDHH